MTDQKVSLLKLINVTRRYQSPGKGAVLPVLDDVSLDVQAGESLAIVGPSGSGKSTLLQILGTLDTPDSGHVLFTGRDLAACTDAEIALVRNRSIGFVFQAHYLLPQCTVLENVLVPTLPGNPGAALRVELGERGRRLLSRVGLGDRTTHRPGQLSGGERQRVAVVRALINRPMLLLADEPTGSLDHASAQELAKLLSELNREEEVTLIVVTHSFELAHQMRRVLELKDGKLQAYEHASPANVMMKNSSG